MQGEEVEGRNDDLPKSADGDRDLQQATWVNGTQVGPSRRSGNTMRGKLIKKEA